MTDGGGRLQSAARRLRDLCEKYSKLDKLDRDSSSKKKSCQCYKRDVGEVWSSWPRGEDTTDDAATAAGKSADEAWLPGIANHRLTTVSELSFLWCPFGPEQRAQPVPTLQQQPQSHSLLMKVGHLG